HLLLALIKMGASDSARLLRDQGADLGNARARVKRLIGTGAVEPHPDSLFRTPRANQAIEAAKANARSSGHAQISPNHILMGLLSDPASVAFWVMTDLGVDVEDLRRDVQKALQSRSD